VICPWYVLLAKIWCCAFWLTGAWADAEGGRALGPPVVRNITYQVEHHYTRALESFFLQNDVCSSTTLFSEKYFPNGCVTWSFK
jgi:hypothetical protein